MAGKNWEVDGVATGLGKLTYTELVDLARQVILAHEGAARDADQITANEVDKMCHALLDGASYWQEIYKS